MAGDKWERDGVSNELTADFRKEHLKLAKGKTLLCEDGQYRKVGRKKGDVVFSYRWPWKLLINEESEPDSKGGHFINVLSFSAQILKQPIPSPKAMLAFETMMKVNFGIGDDGKFNAPPKRRTKITIGPANTKPTN